MYYYIYNENEEPAIITDEDYALVPPMYKDNFEACGDARATSRIVFNGEMELRRNSNDEIIAQWWL